MKLVHLLTGEPEESLREHARQLQAESEYLSSEEFLSRNTDGAGNPLARVYSRTEARELFKDFAKVELRTYFLNKRWLPVLGPILPRSLESQMASTMGLAFVDLCYKRAMKNLLITGGAGFIGSHLVDRLLAPTSNASQSLTTSTTSTIHRSSAPTFASTSKIRVTTSSKSTFAIVPHSNKYSKATTSIASSISLLAPACDLRSPNRSFTLKQTSTAR